MRRARQRDTGIELAIRRRIHGLGFRYRLGAQIPGFRSRPDLIFARQRVVVFVDGCFWHGCHLHGTLPRANRDWWTRKLATNTARDRRYDRDLKGAGWHVVRIWEHEDPDEAVRRLADLLRTIGRAGP